MKLVANFFIMSITELIAEGMTLGEKNGLQRESVVTFLKESFPGPIMTGSAFLWSVISSDCLRDALGSIKIDNLPARPRSRPRGVNQPCLHAVSLEP